MIWVREQCVIWLVCDMVEKRDVDGWADTNELTYVGGDGGSRYEWRYVKKMHICHKTVSKRRR